MNKPHPKRKSPERDKINDLGHILDHFPTQNYKLKRWLPLIIGVLSILAATGLLILLFFNVKNAIQAHGRAIILGIFPFPILTYVGVFIVGILFVFLAKVHWWNSITLFENGLIKDQAHRVQVWHYENTERFDSSINQILFGGSLIGLRAKIVLEDETNKRLVIRRKYIRLPDLIQTLRNSVLPVLFQKAREQLLAGETLHFNNHLQARALGLEINGELFAYDQINAEINNYGIKLYHKDSPKDPVYKSKISRIRNLDLLLDLIEKPINP